MLFFDEQILIYYSIFCVCAATCLSHGVWLLKVVILRYIKLECCHRVKDDMMNVGDVSSYKTISVYLKNMDFKSSLHLSLGYRGPVSKIGISELAG